MEESLFHGKRGGLLHGCGSVRGAGLLRQAGLLTVVVVGLVGCGAEPNATKSTAKTQIVASVGMVADIARAVAGEHADVSSLIGEGVDPHQHSPTRQNMRDLLAADVVLYSGLNLEGRMIETFEQLEKESKPVLTVTSAVSDDQLRKPSQYAGYADPHLWMDVQLWKLCVGEIAEFLAEYDPEHASDYRENASAYSARLEELDQYIRERVASIPEKQRVLITAHDAFGYFGDAYGIEVLAPQGISTESEASVEDINNLVRLIVDREVQAIFVESSVNPKSIQAIIEGVRQAGHEIELGGTLYSDAMGPPGTYTGTYLGMLDHNATTIVRALGGSAPKRGWQGKL